MVNIIEETLESRNSRINLGSIVLYIINNNKENIIIIGRTYRKI